MNKSKAGKEDSYLGTMVGDKKVINLATDKKDKMGTGQSSSTLIQEGGEEGSLNITSNIRTLIEGKIYI